MFSGSFYFWEVGVVEGEVIWAVIKILHDFSAVAVAAHFQFTGSSKINGAKFSDACSVRANEASASRA